MTDNFLVELDTQDGKRLRSIARHIAMDFHTLEEILLTHGVTPDWFEPASRSASFQAALAEEIENWRSAPNAGERVRMKYLTITEEVAPEMYAALIDPKTPLSQRAELLKVVTKLAGLDKQVGADNGAGRVKITINMGAERSEHSVQIDHNPDEFATDGAEA